MDIKQRKEKLKINIDKISFRDMIKKNASRKPLIFYRLDGEVSRYHDKTRFKNIIKTSEFNKLRDDWLPYLAYNFDKNFFENISQLQQVVPRWYIMDFYGNENCEYSDCCFWWAKNCYLTVVAWDNAENILYTYQVATNVINVLNSNSIFSNCENIYTCGFVSNSYNIFFSRNIHNCANIRMSHNLQWCKECVLCNWLENQTYCIQNKQYPKEEYLKLKQNILSKKNKFLAFYQKSVELKNFNSKNSTGKWLINCENVENGIYITDTKDSKNIVLGWITAHNIVNSVDVWINSHDLYWVNSAWDDSNNLYFCGEIWKCSELYYSYFMEHCSYCIWCMWLKNKQFCILNKQYTKEERFELANKIFAQMESDWTLWDFFPASVNPFYFNDTAAYLIDDSFSKKEMEWEWYLRRDDEIKVDIPQWSETVKSTELGQYQWFDSEWNRTINSEILKKVIIDKKWNYYRIVKMEYDFLMKHGLPLPEIHWLERIKLGFKFK